MSTEAPVTDRLPRLAELGRRCLGAVLLGLVLVPWYRLVGLRAVGPAAEQTLRLGSRYQMAVWIGCAVTVIVAVFLSRITGLRGLAPLCARVVAALVSPAPAVFAAGLGLVAAAISVWVSLAVLGARPILLDGISQLVQSRYFAAGQPAGPRLEDAEFWQFQFMVLTDSGWASQYPPGFPAALALAGRLAPLWLLGPVLLGLAVFLIGMIAERIFPEDRVVARVGTTLTALSPFLAFHAATYMNHVLALALVALVALASLLAMDRSWRWSLVSGAALGGLFATRPYTGLILGLFATVLVWLGAPAPTRLSVRGWVKRVGGVVVGAAPFVVGVLLYNRHLFGAATRFGYVAAEGPGHGLGFHVDPWGAPYGPIEAVGYTSADLQGLSLDLLQTPVPAVVLVGLYLLLAPRLSRGAVLAGSWALLPVAAQAFYWHHDLFMGPRLLYEAAAGWCVLLATAAVASIRALPEDGRSSRWGVSRSGLTGTFLLAVLVGVVLAAPAKLASYRSVAEQSGMALSAPATASASLVFVHGSWEDRLAARLAASGMRVDSIRAALAHNATCRLEIYLGEIEASGAGEERPASAELSFAPGPEPRLRELRMPSGSVVRSYQGESLSPRCQREAASDFMGIVGLPPLLWQGDLPGLGSTGAMFVRDLGPERNRRLIDRFRERQPLVLMRSRGAVQLVPYGDGMKALWP